MWNKNIRKEKIFMKDCIFKKKFIRLRIGVFKVFEVYSLNFLVGKWLFVVGKVYVFFEIELEWWKYFFVSVLGLGYWIRLEMGKNFG